MRWAGHVARVDYTRNRTILRLESVKGRDHLEDLDVDGRIVLKLILRKQGWRVWIGLIWLGIDTSEGCSEHGNGILYVSILCVYVTSSLQRKHKDPYSYKN
jgi:hypothetical protein